MVEEVQSTPNVEKYRLMVVEEMRVSTRIIRQALPEDQYAVIEATTPERAVAECDASKPPIAVVDTGFGNNGGYRLCRRLAKEGVGVIALEKHPTKATVTKAALAGAIDVLVAPPEPSTVRSRIHRALVKCGEALPEAGEEQKIEFPNEIRDPRGRVEYVIKQATSLMALPHAVSTVLRLCSEPNSSASDLARPLETDAALSSSVLRLANSVASGSRERFDNLSTAIARLGTKATANLAIAQSVFKMFEATSDTFGFDRQEFWVHSLGAACCAQALAAKCTHLDKDDAFLGALLHDLGKMVLDEFVSVDFQQAVRCAHARRTPVRVGETMTFTVDHAYVGQRVASEWDLPERLCQAIGNHHKCHRSGEGSEQSKDENREPASLAHMTSFADQLSKAMGFGHAGDMLVPRDAVELWDQTQDCALIPEELYTAAAKELADYLDMLGVRPGRFGLGKAEEDAGPVLLCVPPESHGLSLLLDTFFVRRGFKTVKHGETGTLPETDTKYRMVAGFVDGDVSEAEAFARVIGELGTRGVVYTTHADAPERAAPVSDWVYVSRYALDFHFLEEVLLSEGGEESKPDTLD